MTIHQIDSRKPEYVSPRMISLKEEDVAARLGPVLLSGSQVIEPVGSLGQGVKYGASDPGDLIQTAPGK